MLAMDSIQERAREREREEKRKGGDRRPETGKVSLGVYASSLTNLRLLGWKIFWS